MSKQYYDGYVPNEGDPNSSIWFIGEAPGSEEWEQRRPFIGPSGDILNNCLARNGIPREAVYLANLFHNKPFGNKFEAILHSQELKESVLELYKLINQYKPNLIVPLGNWPLFFLCGQKGISKWRGSIISFIQDESIKAIPTYHPAAVLRKRKQYPTFDKDIKRIKEDGKFREKRLPERNFIIDPRGMDIESHTTRLCNSPVLACDIETVKGSSHILCVGFASSRDEAVVFPFGITTLQYIQRILGANNKKLFQNGTFDVLQLEANGIQVNDSENKDGRPYYYDTLIAQHVYAPELPRSLEYLTSIHTREPYYKSSGRAEIPADTKSWSSKVDRNELYAYNGRDCCCTFEVREQQIIEIKDDPYFWSTFNFEMRSLEVAHHISQAGMYRDEERRLLLEKILLKKWARQQFILNGLSQIELNVNSSKQVCSLLYNKKYLGLPVRRNRDGNPTADEDAIVSLISYCKTERDKRKTAKSQQDWEIKHQICRLILEVRGYRKSLSTYILKVDKKGNLKMSADGRVRSTFGVAKTETGRWAASKFVDGTGYNMQTNPRDPVELPDDQLTAIGEELKLLDQLDEHDEEQDENEFESEEAA